MPPTPLDLGNVARALANGGVKVPWRDLVAAYFRQAPQDADLPGIHGMLWETAKQAASDGIFFFPANHGPAWTGAGRQRRPTFIKLPSVRTEKFVDDHAWHQELAFAIGERAGPRRDTLLAIDRWLKTSRDTAVRAPPKERSLEITGDEKRLDQWLSGHSYFQGRLSFFSLRCEAAPLPIPTEIGRNPQNKSLLVVENADTFHSFVKWNQEHDVLAAIAYGAGGNDRALAYHEGYLDLILQRTGAVRILYFGDIDPAGLEIPTGANRRRRLLYLPPIEPATELYRWLLDNGRPASGDDKRTLSPDAAAWIGELAPRIAPLLAEQMRIAQEWLGSTALADPAFIYLLRKSVALRDWGHGDYRAHPVDTS